MYPETPSKKIRNFTLLFMSSLRTIEFYGIKSKWEKFNFRYFYNKLLYKIIGTITNVSIPPYVFEKGLLIMHLQNIVVSAKVQVDEDACLYHNVTLGIKNNGGTGGAPKSVEV